MENLRRRRLGVEKAVTALSKELTITPVRKANIITISYSSGSPQMAAAVLKKLGDLYLEKHLKLNHPAGATDFFKEKAEEYDSQLKQSEQNLTDFQQRNNLVVLEQQKDLTLVRTADAKVKMLDAETALSEATNRISASGRATGLNSQAHRDANQANSQSILCRAFEYDDH